MSAGVKGIQKMAAPKQTVYVLKLMNGWLNSDPANPLRIIKNGSVCTIVGNLNGTSASAITCAIAPAGFRGQGIGPNNYWAPGSRALGSTSINRTGAINVYGNADSLLTGKVDWQLQLTYEQDR